MARFANKSQQIGAANFAQPRRALDVEPSIPVTPAARIDDGRRPLHDPLAEVERQLFQAYVAGAGHDLDALLARSDEDAKRVLAEASRYASAKLSEVEARSHYLHKLHGDV